MAPAPHNSRRDGPTYRRARAIPPDAEAVRAALSTEEPRRTRRLLPVAVGAVLAGIVFSVATPAPPESASESTDAAPDVWTPGATAEAFGIPVSCPRLLTVETTLRPATPDGRPSEASVSIAFAFAAAGEDNERAGLAVDEHWEAARTAMASWLSGHTRLELFRQPGQLRSALAAALTPALFPNGEARVVTASLQRVTLR